MGKRTRWGLYVACWLACTISIMWLAHWDGFSAPPDKSHVLCVLTTAPGEGHFEKTFSSGKAIPQCRISVRFADRGEPIQVDLSGPGDARLRAQLVDGATCYWGRDFPPSAQVHIAIDQGAGHPGATVTIDDIPYGHSAGINGWQILSFLAVALTAVFGAIAWRARDSANVPRRLTAVLVFKLFALGIALEFFYLLLHEGGHAATSAWFGGRGFAGSDFWGIHGSPHAGGMNEHFKPWQRAMTSFAGPAMPSLVGWLMFVWWRSRRGRGFRSRHATWDLFLTAIIAMLVLPGAVVTIPQMLGFFVDGDWRGFVDNVPGPRWLVYLSLTVSVVISVCVLYRTIPHAFRLFKNERGKIQAAIVVAPPRGTAPEPS